MVSIWNRTRCRYTGQCVKGNGCGIADLHLSGIDFIQRNFGDLLFGNNGGDNGIGIHDIADRNVDGGDNTAERSSDKTLIVGVLCRLQCGLAIVERGLRACNILRTGRSRSLGKRCITLSKRRLRTCNLLLGRLYRTYIA